MCDHILLPLLHGTVYIGSPYDQYAASTILLPKRTILANIPVPAENRDEIGHIQIPMHCQFLGVQNVFRQLAYRFGILKVFVVLTKIT